MTAAVRRFCSRIWSEFGIKLDPIAFLLDPPPLKTAIAEHTNYMIASAMEERVKTVPEIIKAAAVSVPGILALMNIYPRCAWLRIF